VIPLSPLALDTVLDLLKLIEPSEQFIFATRSRRRTGPMRDNSLTQGMDYFGRRPKGDALAARTWQVEVPTPHDLRRTVEMRMAELRILKEIRDQCLNHVPDDVGAKHYNQHDYFSEKADAFNRWATMVTSIVDESGGAVVSIAAAREGRR
jgi:integrase